MLAIYSLHGFHTKGRLAMLPPRWMFVIALGIGLWGCSSSDDGDPPAQYEHHIQKIFHVWLVYQSHNSGKSPRDAQELRTWAIANKDDAAVSELLTKMGITDVEGAFTSPRDGQPYVIASLNLGIRDFTPTVAYEKVGVKGIRFVVTDTGRAEQIDESVLQEALKKKS